MRSSFLSFAPIDEGVEEEEEGFFSRFFGRDKKSEKPGNSAQTSVSASHVLPPIPENTTAHVEDRTNASVPSSKKGVAPSQQKHATQWMPGQYFENKTRSEKTSRLVFFFFLISSKR